MSSKKTSTVSKPTPREIVNHVLAEATTVPAKPQVNAAGMIFLPGEAVEEDQLRLWGELERLSTAHLKQALRARKISIPKDKHEMVIRLWRHLQANRAATLLTIAA